MKKIFSILVGLLALVSCASQEEAPQQPLLAKQPSNFELFSFFGDIHNEMLDHMATNFEVPQKVPATKRRAIDYVLSVQEQGLSQMSLSDSTKIFYKEGLKTYKDLYATDDLLKIVLPEQSRTSSNNEDSNPLFEKDIATIIHDAYEEGIIDSKEYGLLERLNYAVIENAMGHFSIEGLQIRIDILISIWEEYYGDIDYKAYTMPKKTHGLEPVELRIVPEGALSAVMLNISKSSLEYWKNQDLTQSRALPAFVGADIAGALIGGCTSAYISHKTTGKVNWKAVAMGSTMSAVVASTGLVQKVGSFICRLF